MGRNTYEFGYKYGLQAGQPAYLNMKHYIFTESLKLENASSQVEIKNLDLTEIDKLKMKELTYTFALVDSSQGRFWTTKRLIY